MEGEGRDLCATILNNSPLINTCFQSVIPIVVLIVGCFGYKYTSVDFCLDIIWIHELKPYCY